ncbi:MAG: hypothetical protein KGL70_04675 [Betaproteobacteria bacterium]|nr:hypothetical protein [Betaproteobacteria bacterium]MDE2209686.1 hypothetical protein [Betaproteobacteria bacterium]MDE2358659.1 hypothetical protein [Betaproteobacteria bacterium]
MEAGQRTSQLSTATDPTDAQTAADLRHTQLVAGATTTFNDNIAAAQAAITKAATEMATAAGVIATTATTQNTAANTRLQAARTPLRITVDTITGAPEVNSGG